MFPIVSALVLAFGAATAAPPPADLQAREREYTRGIRTGNTRLLDDVWAPGFVDTDAAGHLATKPQELAKIAHARARIVALDVDDERTALYGDTAIVTERFHVRYELDGKPGSETGRATDVWVKLGGRWMCVAAHSSAIAPRGS